MVKRMNEITKVKHLQEGDEAIIAKFGEFILIKVLRPPAKGTTKCLVKEEQLIDNYGGYTYTRKRQTCNFDAPYNKEVYVGNDRDAILINSERR